MDGRRSDRADDRRHGQGALAGLFGAWVPAVVFLMAAFVLWFGGSSFGRREVA